MLEDKHRGSAVTFILKSSDTVSHPPSERPVLNANPKIQNTFHLKFVVLYFCFFKSQASVVKSHIYARGLRDVLCSTSVFGL